MRIIMQIAGWMLALSVFFSGALVSQDIPRPSIGLVTPANGTIQGFASLRWGSTRGEIVREKGTPDSERDAGAGAQELVYSGLSIIGRGAAATYTVHPDHGLIEGSYTIAYGAGEDCAAAFSAIVTDISRRYPDVLPKIERRNETHLHLCDAIGIGRGVAVAKWSEEWPGGSPVRPRLASISVVVAADPEVIYVFYSSPDSRDWSRERDAAQRQEVW